MKMDKRIKSIIEFLKKVLGAGLSTTGALWTATEFCEAYFPGNSLLMQLCGNAFYIFIPSMGVAVVYGIYLLKDMYYIRYAISDKQIIISPGDILRKKKGAIVIGINNQLITDPDQIGRKSLHREIVRRYGEEKITEEFEKEKELRQMRGQSKQNDFFTRELAGKQFIFLMMSRIQKPEVAATSKDEIQKAFYNLLSSHTDIRIDSNRLYCPLLGTGEGGVNASADEIAALIVWEFMKFLKENHGDMNRIKDFRVVVYWKDIFRVDWKEVRRKIDCLIENCQECSGLSLGSPL